MRLTTTVFLATFLFFSCTNKKATATADTSNVTTTSPSEMIKKGYVKATVKDFSKSDEGCGFLLLLEENRQLLQPMKSISKELEQDNYKIWLKYRPIRPIAPICKKGIPINIEDIKPR